MDNYLSHRWPQGALVTQRPEKARQKKKKRRVLRTLAVCLLLFAFTSILGWSYYGQQCLDYLTGGRGQRLYRAVFLLCAHSVRCFMLEASAAGTEIVKPSVPVPFHIALSEPVPRATEV